MTRHADPVNLGRRAVYDVTGAMTRITADLGGTVKMTMMKKTISSLLVMRSQRLWRATMIWMMSRRLVRRGGEAVLEVTMKWW